MLGSNNYLDFANEPYIINKTIQAICEYGIGCGGPPLLNGTTSLHRRLEGRLAAMKGTEDAMVYSSGYAANVGWATGLLNEGDFLVYDWQSHASLHDSVKMGKFTGVRFLHNDMEDLDLQLTTVRRNSPKGNVVVCVEGVYSMDGDIAPLPEIKALCKKHRALLCIDDAHGTGVLGKNGHGTQEHYDMMGEVDIIMGTFSKSFGVTGGFIASSKKIIDYLRFFSRSYMFSASLPPSVASSVIAGMEFMDMHPERVQQLHENVEYFVNGLRKAGFSVVCHSAIIPLLVPEQYNVLKLVNMLHREGVFVNGVMYPAVPKDRQRLRISMMATFTKEELDFAVSKILFVAKKIGWMK